MSIPEILSLLSVVGAFYLLIPVLFIERWRRQRTVEPVETTEPNITESEGLSPFDSLPRVSVLFAARNEEASIRATLHRLRGQDYPALEIVAINDRSEDETGRILEEEEMKERGIKVKGMHIDRLPDKWLGKCHALWRGASRAEGEWLLFTDADVAFDPDVVRLAVAMAEKHRADHLTLFPQLLWKGKLEGALLTLFTMMLGVGFRFWQVESRSMNAWVGIGAFNMIRRDLYERFNGHEALRLEVADDMKLGYLAKKYGGKSVALYANGKVRVRWREGARDVVRGIIRSGFAGINFNWWRTLYAAVGIALVFLLPFFLPWFFPSPLVLISSLTTILVLLTALGLTARSQMIPLSQVLLYPIVSFMFLYGILFSAVIATVKGGVDWRGTFYSIRDLKRGSVR